MFETLLFAQDAPSQASAFTGFMPLILIFVIFYFLLIRPQQRQAKDIRKMLAALKKGDRVVSSGGLHGMVTGLTDDMVTMEIAPKVRVKVTRSSIAGVSKQGTN